MSAERVEVRKRVMASNDEAAARIRAQLEAEGVFALNLISSPGSGKTTLLERTVDRMKWWLRLALVAGDVQTERDAERLARHEVAVQPIETGGSCHLDARMVENVLDAFDLPETDLLFIENVGNLVCPSSYDLGESMKVVVMSVTEGEDKPLKYPAAFRKAGALVLTKTDLVPHLDYVVERAVDNSRSINPDLLVFPTSCYTGEGLEAWTDWLSSQVNTRKGSVGVAGS